jgi:hypothetical protein
VTLPFLVPSIARRHSLYIDDLLGPSMLIVYSDRTGRRSASPLLISFMSIHFRPGHRHIIYETKLKLVIIIEHRVII